MEPPPIGLDIERIRVHSKVPWNAPLGIYIYVLGLVKLGDYLICGIGREGVKQLPCGMGEGVVFAMGEDQIVLEFRLGWYKLPRRVEGTWSTFGIEGEDSTKYLAILLLYQAIINIDMIHPPPIAIHCSVSMHKIDSTPIHGSGSFW